MLFYQFWRLKMSVKISVVEKKVYETVNQYNIDEYYINESYGSIERFNEIVNGESLKNDEISLMDFLGEIRPNNIINMQPKTLSDNLEIKCGY